MASSQHFTVAVTYAGTTSTFSFDVATARLSDLQNVLFDTFLVPLESQKIIIKGKRIEGDPVELLASVLHVSSPRSDGGTDVKALLVGPRLTDLQHLERERALREKKHAAFQYHSQHKAPPVRSTRLASSLDDSASYRFLNITPFPSSVPMFEKRKSMLDRLANDPSVLEVMRTHKFIVGNLTELHPLVNPDLLGLNKNKGQEICLRLLTNDLEGTRSYLEVRRVLIHELSHNVFGPHDDNFKALNSQLAKQIASFEEAQGIRIGQAIEPWNPVNDNDDGRRTEHRLNGDDELPNLHASQALRFTQEDQLDERRERMRKAAEDRQRQASKP